METTDTKTVAGELVPTNPTSRDIVKHDPRDLATAGDVSGQEWHNFDGDRRNQWRLKALAQSGSQNKLAIGGEVVPVKYWYVQAIQIYDDRGGQYLDAYRTVLIRPDLSSVAFVSGGVLKSVQSMVTAMGPGPYDPPLEVTVQESQTRRGYRVYSLVPVE